MRLPTISALTCITAMVLTGAGAPSNESGADSEIKYDGAKVIGFTGTIHDVLDVSAPASIKGVHLLVRTEKHVTRVYLCPTNFLKAFDLTLKKGDYIYVVGSKTRFHGDELVLAQQLRRNNDVLELRDGEGKPYWEDEVLKGTGLVAGSRTSNGRFREPTF